MPIPIEKPVPFAVEKKIPYPIIIPVKKHTPYHHTPYHDLHHHHGHQHHDAHHLHHLSTYDHHTDFTHNNNRYQQVSAQRPTQSSEQSSSSSASSSSGEFQEFVPRPEHLREAHTSSQQEQTKLFSPSQQSDTPYNQQHQLHHQQQYAQLRRDLLTRERMRSSSEESEAESTEFRPINSQSEEYMSPSNNVETVVAPPPPNQQTRSSFHINVPNEPVKETTSASGQTNNQFTHNIEIPVHFYRLQPLENGEGFEIAS